MFKEEETAISTLASLAARHPRRLIRSHHVLAVDFEAPDGLRWTAVGGGETLEDAVVFARKSSPAPFRRIVAIRDQLGSGLNCCAAQQTRPDPAVASRVL